MDTRYKIILSNNNVYKEIELAQDTQRVKVGTGVDCDVRLRKELFFCPIELLFVKKGAEWSVLCSDDLYLTVGDIRKLMTKNLNHGDSFEVRYQTSDNFVLHIDFLIDFDDGKRKYERIVDISGAATISIGSDHSNDIVINSPFIKNDAIRLVRKNKSYVLEIKQSTYGVYLNGRKASGGDVVNEGDFLSISDFFFYIKNRKLWTEIRNDLKVNSFSFKDKPERNNYPKFNRNTRLKHVIGEEAIEFLDPPEKPKKPKNNLLLRLMPSMGMLVASGAMAAAGGRMVAMSLISGGMAILTSILTFRENNKEYKEQIAERTDTYHAYIDRKRTEIQQIRDEERSQMESLYVGQGDELHRFDEFSSDLFDRTKTDDDYLCVRLGSGSVEAKRAINYKKQEKLEAGDELQMIPEQISEEFKHVHNAPIVCDLKEINALGVVGAPEYRFQFLKNIVIDIAARQYFSDVKMVFVAEKEHKDKIHWLRFLPHVYNDMLGIRNIVSDDESKNLVYEFLYKELTNRERTKSYEENIIVFFYDDYGFKSHPISRFVENAKDIGVTFVFFGDTTADIAQGCGKVVSVLDGENAVLINADDQNESSKFTYPTLRDDQAEEIVNLLAPVYTEEISLEGTLTKNISMFELLNILAVDDIDLKTRWETSQVHKSMAAPLGVSKTGIVHLDLHDKAHGPHGLVAGTTGSGKSEILQTYILAMATLFHPYEVSFVIIDFKGGGMVNQFKELPHLLGAITNIDGKEINRSLKSIKAELQKRQRLFAEADVNHIDKYIRKYKAGEVEIPLPHLIIIVDEFAELKAEQPEFMKELISAARIGRSLGVHLILATQKPSGQVNEQIWSNSRFKLCLKVQSQEDSNEVLKSPLAAEIKEPGRAYLQVGNNEIFELFQSAYSGASEKTDDSNVKEFTIYGYNESGKKVPVYVQKKKSKGEGSATQLEAIVKYVAEYCDGIKLKKLPDICLPPLPTLLPFAESGILSNGGIIADIGVFDDPSNQVQDKVCVDLEENNVIIIGSTQYGKTNLMMTMIRSLASKYFPSEVNMYVIDFGPSIISNCKNIPHVGGVVTDKEDEKLKNLFKMLHSEIDIRKEKLMRANVSSFKSYKEAGYRDMPMIVLFVDNFTSLKELYLTDEDLLMPLCRNGLSVGISVVLANSQTQGIGYRYLSNFSKRIALYCNDSSEYSTIIDRCRVHPDEVVGRGVIELDKTVFEFQTYCSFEGNTEMKRVEQMNTFIDGIKERCNGLRAKRIPEIPKHLTEHDFCTDFGAVRKNTYTVPIGVDYNSLEPVCVNLLQIGYFATVGPETDESRMLLQVILNQLQSNLFTTPTRMYLVDSVRRGLKQYQNFGFAEEYTIDPSEFIEYIEEIHGILIDRFERVNEEGLGVLNNEPLLFVVVDNADAIAALNKNASVLNKYKEILDRYSALKVCFMYLNVENLAVNSYSGPEILKRIKESKSVFYFAPLKKMRFMDISDRQLRALKKEREFGDGYYYVDGELSRMKVVTA